MIFISVDLTQWLLIETDLIMIYCYRIYAMEACIEFWFAVGGGGKRGGVAYCVITAFYWPIEHARLPLQ